MAKPRRDDEQVLALRAKGMQMRDIASRLGMTVPEVDTLLRAARKRGDVRAFFAKPPPGDVFPAPDEERPGVISIMVPTASCAKDSAAYRVRVSLPRLSILDGWTGAV